MQAVVLGFALAADASAVTAAVSAASARAARDVARLAVAFAVAQGAMTAGGAGVGTALGAWFSAVDHWIAAVVLVGVAVSALRGKDEVPPPLSWGALAVLALATSTDALAAGVALPAMGMPVLASSAVVAGVTFGCCAAAGLAGARLGARFGRRVSVAGAVALLGLAGWLVATG